MAELQPFLLARLFDQTEAADTAEAALEGRVVLLALEGQPPVGTGTHALELHAPGLAGPLVLQATPVGEPTDGLYPLVLRPVEPADAANLRTFAAAVRASAPRREGVFESMDRLSASEFHEIGSVSLEIAARATDPFALPRERIEPVRVQPVGRAPAGEPQPVDPLVGRTVGGRYQVESLIGVGGMGRVYRARHVALDKPVALKVLRTSRRGNPRFAARFHREARAASKVDHPNLVQVIDFGEDLDGLLYIAMELLAGENLGELLRSNRRLPLEAAFELMLQVCTALAVIHGHGMVHRDIKPGNIVIVARRNDEGSMVELVKVCDFGLAKILDDSDDRAQSTVDGIVKGTPEYMSPEQARGGPIDARADLYACGIILYELVTGRVPFTAPTPLGILALHVTDQPVSPSKLSPGVHPALEALILKALSKDRERRQQTARELRDELRDVLEAMRASSRK